MGDSRVLNDKNLNEFIRGNSGQRNALIKYIENKLNDGERSIALCFRGSYFCLYYRCHKLLDVKFKDGKLLASFDFSHAKFVRSAEEYDKMVRELKDKYRVEGFKDDYSGPVKKTVTFDLLNASEGDIKGILDIFIEVTNQFAVRPGGLEYRFGRKEGAKRKAGSSNNTEKDRQQALYSQNFGCPDKFIYDVEYVEPNKHSQDKKVDGRFDLLRLIHEEDKCYLELIELKSTYSACFDEHPNPKSAPSDVKKHLKDYKEYLKKGELIENRIDEAYEVLELLSSLFPEHVKFKLESRPCARIRFIFSDKVKGCVVEEDGVLAVKDNLKHKVKESVSLEGVEVSIITDDGSEISKT